VQSVLLTGATGFVGAHIAARLAKAPLRLHLLVRRQTAAISSLARAGARIHTGGSPDGLGAMGKALGKVDTVIHCAGATRALSRRDFYHANVDFTNNLLQCMQPGQHMVLISSQAAAGPSRPGSAINEEAPCFPVNDYGKSKRMAEKMAMRWKKRTGGSLTIIRPCAVYGPGDRDFYQMFRLLSLGIRFLPPDPAQRISLIHAADLTEAVLLAAQHPGDGQLYFTEGGAHSWKEINRAAEKSLGRPPRITVQPPANIVTLAARLSDIISRWRKSPGLISRQKVIEMNQEAWVCSSDRIRTALGWKPRIPLEEGVAATIAWYRAAGRLPGAPRGRR